MILQFNGKYHLQEAGNRTQPNKHKFVQKVAKKNILLISFEFGQFGTSRAMQAGPSRATDLPNRVKQGQTRLNS